MNIKLNEVNMKKYTIVLIIALMCANLHLCEGVMPDKVVITDEQEQTSDN